MHRRLRSFHSCLDAYYQCTKDRPQTSSRLTKIQPGTDTRSRLGSATTEDGTRRSPGRRCRDGTFVEARTIHSPGRGAEVAGPEASSHGGGCRADRTLHG